MLGCVLMGQGQASQDFPEFPRGAKVASLYKTFSYGCERGSGWLGKNKVDGRGQGMRVSPPEII
jgi:hypothetical protein